jgi:uncharacterized membrane protein
MSGRDSDGSDDGSGSAGGTDGSGDPDEWDDEDDPDMGDLFDELAELEDSVDSEDERERVRETMRMAMEVQDSEVFGRVVFGFDRSDAAEALLGSLLFGIPMFVEGGTEEVGQFIADRPHYFLLTNALTVALVAGILYVADFQDVRVHNPLFGFIPRKFAGVVTIPLVTAAVVMTAWGRVDWADPWLAVCQVAVALVPMAIGAALGDLLPG